MSSQSVFAVDSEPEQKPQIEVSDYESVDFDVSTFEIAKEFETSQIVNDVGKDFESNDIIQYRLSPVKVNSLSVKNKHLKNFSATNTNIYSDIPINVGW